MPAYTYTGDEGRYYSTLGLTPDPGGEYELDRNPGDGRWTPDDPKPAPEPEAEAEADGGDQVVVGDGSGTALPELDQADPGPQTAAPETTPARTRTRAAAKAKEA